VIPGGAGTPSRPGFRDGVGFEKGPKLSEEYHPGEVTMTTVVYIVVLFLGPPCRSKPDDARMWIGIGLLALVGYVVLERKGTKESAPPVKSVAEPVVQPKNEASQAADQPHVPPTPPTPPWMQPPPGVTPPVPPHPLGRNPFEPP
jgi:hypothetical protein